MSNENKFYLTEGGNAIIMNDNNIDRFPETVTRHVYAIKAEISNFNRSTYAIAYHMGQLKKDDNYKKMGFKTIKEMSEKLFHITTSTLYGFADVGLKYIVCEPVSDTDDLFEYHTIFQRKVKKFNSETGEPYYVMTDIPVSNIKEISTIPTDKLMQFFNDGIIKPTYTQSFFKEFVKLYKEMVNDDDTIDYGTFYKYVDELAKTNGMTTKKLLDKYTVKAIVKDKTETDKKSSKKTATSGDEIEGTVTTSGDEIEGTVTTSGDEIEGTATTSGEITEFNFADKWSDITREFDKLIVFAKNNSDFLDVVHEYIAEKYTSLID